MTETIRLRVKPALIPVNGTIAVGSVTTLAPGAPATVVDSGTPGAAVFDFGLPAGVQGDPGLDGADGLVVSVVAGTNVTVDNTDPANPIISATGGLPSVFDYGALGDGTTNDTAAFAAALAAETAVYVPGGYTYIVSGLAVPSGKRLFGDGATSILRNPPNASAPILRLDGVNGVVLEDFAVLGDRFNQTSKWLDDIAVVGSHDITIRNVQATSAPRYGIRIANSADEANDTRTVVTGCTFRSCGLSPGHGGGLFWNKAANIDISNCIFADNLYLGAGSVVHALDASSGNGATTTFAFTYHILVNTDIRVFINSALNVVTEQTLGVDFTVTVGDENGGSIAMAVAPASGEQILIFRVPAPGDIDYETIFNIAEDINQQISLLGNTFIDNTNGMHLGTVYDLDGTQPPTLAWYNQPDKAFDNHVSIVANAFERNDFYAALIHGNHLTFANNRVHANGVGLSSACIVPQGEYLSITGNIIQGNGGAGIDLGMCRYVTITGNEFLDAECYGLELTDVTDVVVTANVFKNCCTANHVASGRRSAIALSADSGYGIYPATKNVIIADNIILPGANQQYGIVVLAPSVGWTYEEIWIVDNFLKSSGTTGDILDSSGLTGAGVYFRGNIQNGLNFVDYLTNRILDIPGLSSGAIIQVRSTLTDSALNLRPKGGGGVAFQNANGAVNLSVSSLSAPTGYLALSASTAAIPAVTATGSATDIDINVVPKGTGRMKQSGNVVPYYLSGSATYDPPSLADGVGATTTVTVTGAALGDMAHASFSLDTSGITITAWVSAANTVSVRFQNESGGVLDIGSGTLKAWVLK